jgi:purine-binding chemotaxis protein CheW
MGNSQQFCTFFLNDGLFGAPVRQVKEVLRPQEVTRVPRACASVRGLINLRGQIVTAIDLRRRLDMPELPAERSSMCVVVHTADSLVSLLVDEIGDVLEIDEAAFEPPPRTVPEQTRSLLRGVYKLQEHLLLVLDTERVVNGDATSAAKENEQCPRDGK